MSATPKFCTLEQLATELQSRRATQNLKVVQCHGVFDLLHIGHIKHLEAARALGDLLVVTVTPDRFVNKGPGRPAFVERLRCEALAALSCVDYVAVNHWPTSVETIELLRPDFYAKGREYEEASRDVTGKISEEAEAVQRCGGRIAFTDGVVFSSSKLLNSYIAPPSEEVKAFVAQFTEQFGFSDVERYVQGARALKVLVVGEAIIDEYQHCHAIGKSSKEPTLVVKRAELERFAGGILAVANHVAAFTDQVSVLAMLGRTDPQLEFVEANLDQRIQRHYLVRKDGPTIVKRRYIEHYFFQKLLEIYQFNDMELEEDDNKILCDQLKQLIPQHDLVIVVDYGHGFLSQEAIAILCQDSKYLAVNAQCNAGNLGYHTISQYARADFVTMTEGEIRLEARRRRGDLKAIVRQVASRLESPTLCVTRGSNGSMVFEPQGSFLEIPAIAGKVVDRVGAGDAFLSVAALCAAQGAPSPIIGLLGNAAGAQAVATVCNKEPVHRVALLKHLQALLK